MNNLSKTVKTIDYKKIAKLIHTRMKKIAELKAKKSEVVSKINGRVKVFEDEIEKLEEVLRKTMLKDSTVEVKDDTYTKKVSDIVTFSLSKENTKLNVKSLNIETYQYYL